MKKSLKKYLYILTILFIIILVTYYIINSNNVKFSYEISPIDKLRMLEVLSLMEHSLEEEEINYVCDLLDTEILWESIEWDGNWNELDAKEISPEIRKNSNEIGRHYRNLASAITILCNIIDSFNNRNLLMDKITLGVNKLITEQEKDGSWYGRSFILYTSKNLQALNYYYKISNDRKVLLSIKKANSWFIREFGKSENNMRNILACFYSKYVYNLPDGLEEVTILEEMKEIYLKEQENLFSLEVMRIPNLTFVMIALINSDLLNISEKERIIKTIIRIIREETRGFKDFNDLGIAGNIRCGYYLTNCYRYANSDEKELIVKISKKNREALRKFLK